MVNQGLYQIVLKQNRKICVQQNHVFTQQIASRSLIFFRPNYYYFYFLNKILFITANINPRKNCGRPRLVPDQLYQQRDIVWTRKIRNGFLSRRVFFFTDPDKPRYRVRRQRVPRLCPVTATTSSFYFGPLGLEPGEE